MNVSGKRRTFEWFGAAVDHPASDHPPAIPLSSIRIHNRRRVFKPTIPCTRLRTHTLESHQRGQAVPERKQANHSKATPENLSHALDRSEEHQREREREREERERERERVREREREREGERERGSLMRAGSLMQLGRPEGPPPSKIEKPSKSHGLSIGI